MKDCIYLGHETQFAIRCAGNGLQPTAGLGLRVTF